MKQKNTDSQAQRQRARRSSAIGSAVFFTLLRLVTAGVLLWARAGLEPTGFLSKLVLIFILLDVGSVLPLWFSLKARLKEIEGGEEDAAAQY